MDKQWKRDILIAIGGLLLLVLMGMALVAPFYFTSTPGDSTRLRNFLDTAILVSTMTTLGWCVVLVHNVRRRRKPSPTQKATETPEAVAAWERHVAKRLSARPNLQVTDDGRTIMGSYESSVEPD